jgi:hypothetical protein
MLAIRTYEDLDRLIKDGVMESLTLDYKQSLDLQKDPKKKDKLCVEVTSFANSAGGQLVYGMKEDKHYPTEIDEGAEVSKEWIEQVIDSNVQPRIEGLVIHPIKLTQGWGYCIDIPQATSRAPHQAPDKRYYKRQNFQSVPMEDYEIKDVLKRATTPNLDIERSFEGGSTNTTMNFPVDRETETVFLKIRIINHSSQPAYHVFSEVLIDTCLPSAFTTHTYPSAGQQENMRIHRHVINSPPNVPIFKEGDPVNHEGIIALSVNKRLAFTEGASARLRTRVQTPGFLASGDWKIRFKNGLLELVRE